MSKNNIIEVNTVDILEGIVELMIRTIIIDSVDEPNPGEFELKVKNVYWVTPVHIYEINGDKYKVVSVSGCDTIVLKGVKGNEPAPSSGDTINLPAPFFWHGTHILTDIEWSKISDDKKIFPAIYAVEPITDRFDNDPLSIFDRISSVKFFGIVTANVEDWLTDQHYINAINPMRRMIAEFKRELDDHPEIGEFDSFDIINRANLGVIKANSGNTSSLTNMRVSGVEFDVSIPIETDLACKYFCEC